MNKLAIFFTVLLLSGCGLKDATSPYSKAPISPSSLWYGPKEAMTRIHVLDEEDVETKVAIETVSKEKPLTLAEIVDIALSANPATKKSWAQARNAAAVFGQSLKNYFVLADINGGYELQSQRQFTSATLERSTDFYNREYGGEIDLSYILLDFGQTRYTSLAALETLFSADWSHNSTLQQTMKNVIDDFYNYLLEKKLLKAQEMDLINAQVTLDSTKEKFKMGLADVSDVVQATTSYLKQQLDLITQQQSTHNAYTLMVETMGYSSDADFKFQDFPDEITTFTPESLDFLIEKAIANRPDLMAQESIVKAKEASLNAARAKRFPVINTGFQWGRQFQNAPITGEALNKYNATIALTVPLFQGFYITNTIKQQSAELTSALSDLKQLRLEIEQEVSNYRTAVILSAKALKYAAAYLESAEEDYKVYLEKYRTGTTNIVDLIQAQTAVSDARAKKATSEQQWYSAVADLTYSTGLLVPSRLDENKAELKLGEIPHES